tara:strand:+ start:976 stop:1149 length:174 start_codon:yes stop_codon:yes gene_type:complete
MLSRKTSAATRLGGNLQSRRLPASALIPSVEGWLERRKDSDITNIRIMPFIDHGFVC